MSYSPLTSKLFKFTALTVALALAGCGGDGTDTVAPPFDGGNNGGQTGGGDNGGVTTPEADFFLQTISVSPTNIELSDEPTTFIVTVKAAEKTSGGAVVNKDISLKIEDSENKGITIDGQNTVATDSNGSVTYSLTLNPKAVTDKDALILNGFRLIATATKADGSVITQPLNVSVFKKGDGGTQIIVSKLDIGTQLTTSSVSNNILNPYGDSAQLSVTAKNENGARVKDVTIGLGIDNIKGISIIDNSKITDTNGVATFEVKIDSNLTEVERNKLLQGVAYAVSIKENSGATKTVSGTFNVAIPVSDYVLNIAASSEPLNAYGDSQLLMITATPKNVNVPTQINGAKVSIKLNNAIEGVSLANENLTLNAEGKASVALNIASDLDQATREKLAQENISYTLVLKEPNSASTTKNLNRSVYIPEQKYQVNFNSADKKQLSSSGGSAVISFRVNNLSGGIIAGQEVTARLPSDLIASGLLTLASDSKQITDNKGEVSYTVRIPNNLTTAQKTSLENAATFVLTATIKEPLGITSEATSERITIGSDIGISDINLTVSSVPTVINIVDEQFKLQVFAKRKDGSAANNRAVKLILNSGSGVTIRGNEQTTNASGIAEFTVDINPNINQVQRDALIASGVSFTAVLTDSDGTQSKTTQNIKVALPATSMQFASIITPTISELGGNGSVNVKLTSKSAPVKPIREQAVAIQLGATALKYGITVNQTTATTDFNGEAIFTVSIPENLTAVQRVELKRTGINYQLSYVENEATYDSEVQKVNITTPEVDITVLNAPNLINNRPFYTLNGEGDTTVIQAELSTRNTSVKIAGQPLELAFNDTSLAALLNVNGKLGSATSIVSTDANGAASFTVIVPSNLTSEQKDKLQNKRLTATLTETLTGRVQEIQFNVQSTKAAIDLISISPTPLNLNGGEIQVEVIAQDSKNNVIEGQKVFLALPAAIAAQGVILATSGTQTTNDSGKAAFTIAVPAGLSDTQKSAIGNSFKVALTAADDIGNIATNTSTITTFTPTANGTQENLTIGANKIVNTKGDNFKVFVQVANDGRAINGRTVRLNVDEPIKTGVTVTNGTATTNSDGVATFDLTLEPGANVNQALLESGIRLTATTTTAENTELTQNYIVAVDTTTIDSYQILASSDKPTLNTGGDQTNATFRVTDTSGGILVGVPVQLSIENLEASGAALTTSSIVMTDAEGKVDVGILLAANSINARLNHSVVINAKIVTPTYDANGNVSMEVREEKSLSLSAVGTQITLASSATNLKDGETTTITTTLIDGAGRAIANAGMELVDANSNSITTSMITDADGKASFEINEADLTFDSNGNLQVFARAIGEKSLVTQRSANSIDLIKVSQAGISFIDINDAYDVNVSQNINVQIRTDSPAEANALLGKSVEMQTTIGTFANNDVITIKTISASNINGNIITVPVALTSGLAGTAVLEAKVLGIFASGNSGALKYQTTVDTRFRATTPAKMLFQAVKSVITPGTSTEIVATVKDENDVPVEGQTVVFSRISDSSAGRLSAATAITDRRGEARVVYTANASSPIGGVVINGRLLNDNANIGTKTTNITVSEEAVYTTLSFSNVVSSDTIYYTKRGSISVMDGSGRAVANQEVSIKSYATQYAQGRYCILDSTLTYQAADEQELDENGNVIKVTTPDSQVKSEKVIIDLTSNSWIDTEDGNYNYTLDNDSILNEDENNNGSLEAINPVAIIGGTVSDDGYTFVTDSEGRADFEIRYPLRYSNWVKVRFDATTFLNGSENTQSINYQLPSADNDLSINGSNLQTPWIDNTSPFGSGGAICVDSMSVIIDDQEDSTKVTLSPYKAGQVPYAVSINGNFNNTSTTGFNSYIVDFNQAFALGSTVTVTRNGFDFSRTLKVE